MGFFSRTPKPDPLQEHFKNLDAARDVVSRQRIAILRRIRVVDRMCAEPLHTPVYDCVSDRFELPCAHQNFEFDIYSDGVGPISAQELEERYGNTKYSPIESETLVDCGESVVFIKTDTLLEPGATVRRYVRIADDTWFAYWWRTGMRRGTSIDPPLVVKDMVDEPSRWLERERQLKSLWAGNPNYRSILAECPHINR